MSDDDKSLRTTTTDRQNAVSYKCVMLGDAAVGKTCIVQRFLTRVYKEHAATAAQDFSSKTMSVVENG
jgi:GTPase SAR1 family protein